MELQLTQQACITGTHTDAAPVSAASTTAAKPSEPNHVTVENGVETYSTGASGQNASSSSSATAPIKMADLPPAEPEKEEEDDLSLAVPEGARCKRRACGATWEGENVSRGDGENSKCRYHPLGVSLYLICHVGCSDDPACLSRGDKVQCLLSKTQSARVRRVYEDRGMQGGIPLVRWSKEG